MENNIKKFQNFFQKSPKEFQESLKTDLSKEIYQTLLESLQEKNMLEIVNILKEDILYKEGYILDNLLLLEPLSLPIIDILIDSGFLEETYFLKKIELTRTLSSNILKHLNNMKKKIRKNDVSITGISSFQLNNVLKELDKHKYNDMDYLQTKVIHLTTELDNLKKTPELQNNSFYKENMELKQQLQEYERVFKQPKIMKLLNTILNNPSLVEFRKSKNIMDSSPKSIFNLLILLYSAREFIDSYYSYLVGYKQHHQYEMDDNEISFYIAVNEYFNSEIIINPIQKYVEEDKFDKAIHRSIDLKYRDVTLSDDKIILIPADNVGHKIKVKIN